MQDSQKRKEIKKMIGLELDWDLYHELVEYAASIGGSVSSAVRFILINYLKEVRKEDNE